MNLLELFAGAGGAALGLRAAGYHGNHYEWDADAHTTLTAAGFTGYCMDVRKARWQGYAKHYGRPHLMWASPPCQAFSQAGTRLGAKDPRNGWPWTWVAAQHVKPTWLVCENVPGLTHHSAEHCGDPDMCAGCYWERVVVPEFKSQFDWVGVWKLNAADYGVPQTRRRVFLVAGPHPIAPPRATHSELGSPTLWGTTEKWVSIGEALGLNGVMDDGSRNTDANPNQERPRSTDEPAPAIGGRGNQMMRIIGGGPSTTIAAQQAGNAGPWVVDHGMKGSARTLDKPSTTLRDGNCSGPLLRPAPCVTATEGKGRSVDPTKKNRASDALFMGTGRRRLTVEECAILQGFPADHPFKGTKASRYRQVGNAVPPALAEAIARAIPSPQE